MSNIYICISNREEKVDFLLDFLNLRAVLNGSDNVKRSKKAKQLNENGINELIRNVDDGLYRKLHRYYYGGYIPEHFDTSIPWTFPGLYARGIRSLYTQKSYMHRPGIWLAIELRDTKAGRQKHHWIMENIPQSKIGLNVPLPESYFLKERLKYVKRVMSFENPEPYAEKALEYLLEVKKDQPRMFRNHNVYLWEEMARLFDSLDMPDKALLCYEMQAELMPECSDPYLNMAVIYKLKGDIDKAIETNLKGLEINPHDEYIYYNLSSLLMENEMYDIAIKHINSAILANPTRGLNYNLKGDIHFGRREFHLAVTSYEWALSLFDKDWQSMAEDCRQNWPILMMNSMKD